MIDCPATQFLRLLIVLEGFAVVGGPKIDRLFAGSVSEALNCFTEFGRARRPKD